MRTFFIISTNAVAGEEKTVAAQDYILRWVLRLDCFPRILKVGSGRTEGENSVWTEESLTERENGKELGWIFETQK
jgi:hypothetical protein